MTDKRLERILAKLDETYGTEKLYIWSIILHGSFYLPPY